MSDKGHWPYLGRGFHWVPHPERLGSRDKLLDEFISHGALHEDPRSSNTNLTAVTKNIDQ